MKPIDFDARFTKYAETWVREQLKAGKKPEVLEEQMPELYMRFINSPAHWLDGVSPAMYFAQWERLSGDVISRFSAECVR